MSSLKTPLLLLTAVAALAFSGCGDANKQAVFTPETGHPTNWQTGHKTAGKANIESCFECHGEELDGGIAKQSCTTCHLGGATKIHPGQWGSYAYARHSGYLTQNDSTTCANAVCHGTTLSGVTNSGPSCTSCHDANGSSYTKHPTTWTSIRDHGKTVKGTAKIVSAQTTTTCSNTRCHGTDLKGVFLSGPSCETCHSKDTATGEFIKHPTTWASVIPGHKVTTDFTSCKTAACHGSSLNGGTYGATSCYTCHINYSENSSGIITKHPANIGSWRTEHSIYVSGHKPLPTPTCVNSACHLAGTRTADAYCKNCHNGK